MKSLLFVLGMVVSSGVLADVNASSLTQKNACMSCHSVDKKVVGPSFKDISAKYSNDATAVDKLSKSIKLGSKNNWSSVPMPPMGAMVSDESIKVIVSWILTLK